MTNDRELIVIHDHDGVRRIVIDRAERKNALTQAMYATMIAAIEDADASPSIRAIIVTGAGSVFTSGNDLADFAGAGSAPAGKRTPAAQFPFVLDRTQKPLVAAVNGPAVGIGTTMLLQCDLVYAADVATFRTPFVDLALVPEGASSLLMPAAVGRVCANELLMLGETWTAAEAFARGLVTRVFPSERLLDEAIKRASLLASKAPAALRAAKALISAPQETAVARIERAEDAFRNCLNSPEFAEAAQAFMTRRTPNFSRFA